MKSGIGRTHGTFARTLPRRPARLGWMVLALLVAAGIGYVVGARTAPRKAEPAPSADTWLAADPDGAIDHWLLGVPETWTAVFADTQAELIARAEPDVTFHVVHSQARGKRMLADRVARLAPEALARIRWHRSPHPVSPWVRDYFRLGRGPAGAPIAWLHHVAHYRGASGPSASQDPTSLVGALPLLDVRRTDVRIEGGGLVADEAHIFATRSTATAAVAAGQAPSPEAYAARLARTWGRPVTWIDAHAAAPNGHCDLFLMPVGGRQVVLGDPTLAVRLLQAERPEHKAAYIDHLRQHRPNGPDDPPPPFDFTGLFEHLARDSVATERLAALRAIEVRLRALGYRIARVPFLAVDPERYGLYVSISHANVVMDVRGARRIVYLPTYGLPVLDHAATQTWRGLGFEVVPIDARGPGCFGGAVRCLGQVVRR